MRVLLGAYACSPSGGSESAVGWAWATALARRGHDVTVLTPDDVRAEVEAAAVPQGLSFAFVPEPPGSGLVPGQLHWYVRYLRWQRAAGRRAAALHAERPFDVAHHLTWASLQLGTGLLGVGPPVVFGPVGGGQTAPAALRPFHRGRWWTEQLRTLVTTRLIRLDPFATATARTAALAVADNAETAALLRRLGARRVHEQTQCGIDPAELRAPDDAVHDREVLELVWVGRLLPRKGVALAVEAMRRLPADVPARLRIVGHGPQEADLPQWIQAAGQAHRIRFDGPVPHAEVGAVYEAAGALLFTSLRDSGGIQLVEAMGRGLPCIALDHHGARLLVTDDAGLRVPVGDAEATAGALAAAIQRLAGDRDLRRRLSRGALDRATALTWDALVAELDAVVAEVVGADGPDGCADPPVG